MERSLRRAYSSESLAKSVEISNNPKRDLESSMDHEANLVSSVGSSNGLVEQVECPDRSGEQVITLKSLAGNLGSSWSVDSSDLEQEVLSLQEQVHAEKDMSVVLEVQDEKWRLGMDDKFGVKAWKFSDLLKRARPIQRISVNGKSTKGKSAKVKMKSLKEKIKSIKEKIKSDKEKIKSVKQKSK